MADWLDVWKSQDTPISYEDKVRGFVYRRIKQGCVLVEGTWYRFCNYIFFDLEYAKVFITSISGYPTSIEVNKRKYKLTQVVTR